MRLFTQADSADAEVSDVAAATPADTTPIHSAHLELRFLLCFLDPCGCRHSRFTSLQQVSIP